MKKEYPRYSAKFKKNGKWSKVFVTWSSTRFFKRLNLNNCEKVYLRVAYSPTEHNDGYYTDNDELKLAWECFTDKDLVREFCPKFRIQRRKK